MKRYRFRILDEGGYVLEERDFQANNDSTALKLAEGWRDGRPCEILSATARLAHWDGGPAKVARAKPARTR